MVVDIWYFLQDFFVVVCFIFYFRSLTLKRMCLCRVGSVSKALIVSVLYLCGTVLLLVPTRELALQTSQVCKELAKHLNIQIMVTTGGTGLRDDIMRLYQPVHLLVGTPGRVLDLANKGVCNLRECAMLVMDEVRAGLFIAQSLGLSCLCYSLGWGATLQILWGSGCRVFIDHGAPFVSSANVLIHGFLNAGW
jgi:hypothetical protein